MREGTSLKKSLLFLLTISLCFNLFFAGGYISTCTDLRQLNTAEGRMEWVGGLLSLTEEQEETFVRLQEELLAQSDRIKEEHGVDIGAYWEEIVKDDPDPERLEELLERSSAARKEYFILRTRSMEAFMQELTPEQRQAYVQIIRMKGK